MTPTQIICKRISISLRPEEFSEIEKISKKAGIHPSRVVTGMVRQYISDGVSLPKKYQYVCSECLRSVNKLYQQDKCRACLNRDFKRLRKLMNVTPANQHLRESKGD